MPTKTRLLLIEDDFDVAEMLQMYFESHGYELLHADTGTDGIQLARTSFPTIILLDVMLPDMDGYEIFTRLRNMSLTQFIPIIFLTQRDERAARVKGLEIGADDYITKPFDIEELRLRIQASVRRATRENLNEPRTSLPTGDMVTELVAERLAKGFKELRLYIDGFTEYADVYSFMAANDVLYHASKIIREVVGEMGTDDDFVGIQEDTFVIMTAHDTPELLVETARTRFDKQVKTFYTFADADRGGIIVNAGESNERLAALMNLQTVSPAVQS